MLGWLFSPKVPRCGVCGKRMRLVKTIDEYDRMPGYQLYQCRKCGSKRTVEVSVKLKTHPEW